MNVLIIEDEQIAADNLEHILAETAPDIRVLDKIDSVRGAVEWLSANEAELIFLDIHLSDGLAFQIFEQIEVKTPIIFTTAYDQYAIKAFKVNSIDYLLKPIDKDDLQVAIEKYRELNQSHTTGQPDYQRLLEALSLKKKYQKRFIVYVGDKIRSVKIEDIAFFYSKDKMTFLQTFKSQSYDISYSLERLEQVLNPEMFFRVNRKYIVNIEAIENMYMLSKSRLQLELCPRTDEEVFVSFSKSPEFKRWLGR